MKYLITFAIISLGFSWLLYAMFNNQYLILLAISFTFFIASIIILTKQKVWYGPIYFLVNFILLCLVIPAFLKPSKLSEILQFSNIDSSALIWAFFYSIICSIIYLISYYFIVIVILLIKLVKGRIVKD